MNRTLNVKIFHFFSLTCKSQTKNIEDKCDLNMRKSVFKKTNLGRWRFFSQADVILLNTKLLVLQGYRQSYVKYALIQNIFVKTDIINYASLYYILPKFTKASHSVNKKNVDKSMSWKKHEEYLLWKTWRICIMKDSTIRKICLSIILDLC